MDITQAAGFDITPASEIMAILCLSKDIEDLKQRIGRIILGYTYEDKPFTVDDLGVTGAITVLLKDAIHPNVVQTLEGTPAFIHGGPFANIAHGCNSITATKMPCRMQTMLLPRPGSERTSGLKNFLISNAGRADCSPN
jgi:formate--tetrahydrofolate ligase